jgi:hypothetical protein
MFEWRLFLLITGICIPGIITAIPRVNSIVEKNLQKIKESGKQLPPRPVLLAVQMLQTLLLCAGFSALGVWLAPKIAFGAPFLRSLVTPGLPAAENLPPAAPVLVLSAGGAVLFLILYYLVFERLLDPETVRSMERVRMEGGLATRIFYGGIVEEVLMRWGLLTVLLFLFNAAGIPLLPALIWPVIIAVGVLFGLAHLPTYLAAGCKKTPVFILAMIVLNCFAGTLFGYLYWNYGLFAAIVSHALFHIIWYPFDVMIAGLRGSTQHSVLPQSQ